MSSRWTGPVTFPGIESSTTVPLESTDRWTGPVARPPGLNPLDILLKPGVTQPVTSSPGISIAWATVTSAYPDPVQVQIDTEDEPLPGVPSMLCTVGLGDRVLVLLWGRRMVVLGVAQPDQSRRTEKANGNVLITPTAVNTVTTADVVFDEPFDEVPAITVTPSTTSPLTVFATYQDATTDGFTIYFARTDNTSPTKVSWTAGT